MCKWLQVTSVDDSVDENVEMSDENYEVCDIDSGSKKAVKSNSKWQLVGEGHDPISAEALPEEDSIGA